MRASHVPLDCRAGELSGRRSILALIALAGYRPRSMSPPSVGPAGTMLPELDVAKLRARLCRGSSRVPGHPRCCAPSPRNGVLVQPQRAGLARFRPFLHAPLVPMSFSAKPDAWSPRSFRQVPRCAHERRRRRLCGARPRSGRAEPLVVRSGRCGRRRARARRASISCYRSRHRTRRCGRSRPRSTRGGGGAASPIRRCGWRLPKDTG